jgi:hypothetical protein
MHKYISQISHVKTLQQNSDAEYTAFMILQSAVNNLDFRGVGGGRDQNCGWKLGRKD